MWGTSQGDRTLIGYEADLVRHSVGYLRDMITAGIDLDDPYQSCVGLFNRLQPTQQLAVLHEVAYGLLDPSTPILELTAVREATVYAIYRELVSLIEIEIDLAHDDHKRFGDSNERVRHPLRNPNSKLRVQPEFRIRSSIFAACQASDDSLGQWSEDELRINDLPGEWEEAEFDVEDNHWPLPPTVDSEDMDQWSTAIEYLSDRVLWDRDFEMEEIFADHDPAKIADIKQYFGIHEDYFSTPAPDAYSEEYQRLDHELVKLTQNPDA